MQLVTLTEIHKQLASMTNIVDVKEARDRAEAIRTYCQRARKGLAAQNEAAYVKILAERRAGELLAKVGRVQGNRDGKDGLRSTLERSGISVGTAHNWQILAQLPSDRRQQLGEEAIGFAHRVKIDALARLGELLDAVPKATARFTHDGTPRVPSSNDAPTLADYGISKRVSAVARQLAKPEFPLSRSEQPLQL